MDEVVVREDGTGSADEGLESSTVIVADAELGNTAAGAAAVKAAAAAAGAAAVEAAAAAAAGARPNAGDAERCTGCGTGNERRGGG